MNNIEHDYLKLLKDILDNGVEKKDRTGTGTRSVFGRQIRHDMSLGFPLLTTKKMAWKTMVTELLWFLRGDTNIKYLVDNDCQMVNIKDWFINKIKTDDEFAKKWGELGPIYGHQWRDWGARYETNHILGTRTRRKPGIDQIANLIHDLKTNPDSRRLMVSAWNVDELDQMTLPPCHYGFQVYTRELSTRERLKIWINRSTDKEWRSSLEQAYHDWDNPKWVHGVFETDMDDAEIPKRTISLMWNQRSADVFLGLPFNIASYGLLLEIIAKAVGMIPDELIGNIGDAHLYLNHIEQAKEQMHRELYPLPKLMFKDHLKDFDNIIDVLRINNFILDGYQSHPTIKAPLSN